ncbi:unnamed protein product [Gadus morhua 'NCC']
MEPAAYLLSAARAAQCGPRPGPPLRGACPLRYLGVLSRFLPSSTSKDVIRRAGALGLVMAHPCLPLYNVLRSVGPARTLQRLVSAGAGHDSSISGSSTPQPPPRLPRHPGSAGSRVNSRVHIKQPLLQLPQMPNSRFANPHVRDRS